jgi:hypothetical protein
MVEKSDFSDYIIPPADPMATAVIDYINYHRDIPLEAEPASTPATPP